MIERAVESPRRCPPSAILGMLAAAVLGGTAWGCDRAGTDAPRLVVPGPGTSSRSVEVAGLGPSTVSALRRLDPQDWNAVLTVHTAAAAAGAQAPALLGDYRVEEDRAVFTPRFPFVPGMSYRVRFVPPSGAEPVESAFSIAEVTTPSPVRVAGVYPSAYLWPMNQLKMYIHFSGPMRPGRAFEHIRVIDETDGTVVAQPFVTVQQELWDPNHETLTVLYDPGRIKRGLVPNQQAGLPLRAGRSYRLVVDAGWRDAEGRPLVDTFERRFSIGAPDRDAPHPRNWTVSPPPAGSRQPLVVGFGESMDHGLLVSLVGVRRTSGGAPVNGWSTRPAPGADDQLRGVGETAEQESEWRFTPEAPWSPGTYEVVVPTVLEDLAGNTLKSLFDVDLGEAPGELADQDTVFLAFVVRPP